MNDVKMMLGKRAAQYYLFITWCITAPLLTLVSTCVYFFIQVKQKGTKLGCCQCYTLPVKIMIIFVSVEINKLL
jgi:hypothetical protein